MIELRSVTVVFNCVMGRKYIGPRRLARVGVFGVGDDADDFVVGGILLIERSEVPADGIFVGEEFLDERLVYDRNHARSCGVLIGEAAAAHNRLADGLEEVRAHPIPRGAIVRTRRRRGTAFHKNFFAPVIAFERAVERESDALDARECGEFALQLQIRLRESWQWCNPRLPGSKWKT